MLKRRTPLLTVVRNIVKEAEKSTPGTELLFWQGRLKLVIEQQNQLLVLETHQPCVRYASERLHIVLRYYEVCPESSCELVMTNEGKFIFSRSSLRGPLVIMCQNEEGETCINPYRMAGIGILARFLARSIREAGFVHLARTHAQVSDTNKAVRSTPLLYVPAELWCYPAFHAEKSLEGEKFYEVT